MHSALQSMQGVFNALHESTEPKRTKLVMVDLCTLGAQLGEHMWPDQFCDILAGVFGENTPAYNHSVQAAMSVFEQKLDEQYQEAQDGLAVNQT